MSPLEDCDYTCSDCGRVVCRDNEPSPGEQGEMCSDCYDAEVEEGRLRSRDYEAWAAL